MSGGRALDLDLHPKAHAQHELQLNVYTYGPTVQHPCMRETVYFDVDAGPTRAGVKLTPDEARVLANQLLQVADQAEQAAEERERAESFQRIAEEMRDAEDTGAGTSCYYCHPDIHYVAVGCMAAKVDELEAAGAQRYMVLPDPGAVHPQWRPLDTPAPYPAHPARWPEGLTHLQGAA